MQGFLFAGDLCVSRMAIGIRWPIAVAMTALVGAGLMTTALAQSPPTPIPRLTPHDGATISEGPLTLERRLRRDKRLREARARVRVAENAAAATIFTGTNEQRLAAAKELEDALERQEIAIILIAAQMTPATQAAWTQFLVEHGRLTRQREDGELSAAALQLQIEAARQRFINAIAPEIEMVREAIRASDAAGQEAGAAPTPIGLRPTFGNTNFYGSGMVASLSLPQQSYLGSFDPVSGQDRIGLFQTNRRVTMTGGFFSFEQNFGSPPPYTLPGSGVLRYAYSATDPARNPLSALGASSLAASAAPIGSFFAYGAFHAAEGSASGSGTFDPGAGNRTLLPGPLGGASGVSLGGYPANVVTGIAYRNEYESVGGMIGLGYRFSVSRSVRISAGGHIGFHRGETEQHFSGAIPGFARVFAYDTSITTSAFTFGAKGQVDWMALPTLRTFVKGHAGAGLVKGDGNDTLTFTGLPTSTVALNADRTQIVGGVLVGFEHLLAAGPRHSVSVGAEVGFERVPGFASVARDGTNPSQLQLSAADAFSGKAKLGILF